MNITDPNFKATFSVGRSPDGTFQTDIVMGDGSIIRDWQGKKFPGMSASKTGAMIAMMLAGTQTPEAFYPIPDEKSFHSFGSETEKYRHLTAPYCTGCGVDVASQGVAVVPWAMSFDLPQDELLHYSAGLQPKGPIPLRGHADRLPFFDASLDFVYSSHYLEDCLDWLPTLSEWCRCVKVGGYLINLGPDKDLWAQAIANGQPPNCSHKHEPVVGEMSAIFREYFGHFEVIKDELTNVVPGDYSIIFCARRIR